LKFKSLKCYLKFLVKALFFLEVFDSLIVLLSEVEKKKNEKKKGKIRARG